MIPHTCPPAMKAELERLAAVVRAEHPKLEQWVLGYVGTKLEPYHYETWYRPDDRPYVRKDRGRAKA